MGNIGQSGFWRLKVPVYENSTLKKMFAWRVLDFATSKEMVEKNG
jgi:hypothetical protein